MKIKTLALAGSAFSLLGGSINQQAGTLKLPTFSTISTFSTLKPVYLATVTPIYSGPYEQHCDDFYVAYSINYTGVSKTLHERLVTKYYKDGVWGESTYNTTSHYVNSGSTYTAYLKVPSNQYLNENYIVLTFYLLDSSDSIIRTIECNLNAKVHNTISPLSFKKQACVYNNYFFGLPTETQEKILFKNTLDYFPEDSYYRLNVNKIFFDYTCNYPTLGEAYLKFNDKELVFPYITRDKLKPDRIPLSMTYLLGKVYFSFNDVMYVDPKTLQMSLTPREGFKATRYFYLPINLRQYLQDKLFTIEVRDFGNMGINFDLPVTYLNTNNLIGDCDNSDYCVVGELV